MAVSTEATVRDAVVAAVRGIATTELGFDESNGNVRDYLVEHEQAEKVPAYLSALVGGRRIVRVWSVHVDCVESVRAGGSAGGSGIAHAVIDRNYRVRVVGIYGKGIDGTGVKALIDGARKVRAAVYALGTTLSGTATTFEGVSELRITPAAVDGGDDPTALIGEMVFAYFRGSADF